PGQLLVIATEGGLLLLHLRAVRGGHFRFIGVQQIQKLHVLSFYLHARLSTPGRANVWLITRVWPGRAPGPWSRPPCCGPAWRAAGLRSPASPRRPSGATSRIRIRRVFAFRTSSIAAPGMERAAVSNPKTRVRNIIAGHLWRMFGG